MALIEPSITTTSSTGNLDSKRYTDEFGGTSSSAPLVAGVAAPVISANPALSAAQVKEILKETADKINPGIMIPKESTITMATPNGMDMEK